MQLCAPAIAALPLSQPLGRPLVLVRPSHVLAADGRVLGLAPWPVIFVLGVLAGAIVVAATRAWLRLRAGRQRPAELPQPVSAPVAVAPPRALAPSPQILPVRIPGALTPSTQLGTVTAARRLLTDLEERKVTLADGPPALVERLLTTAAAQARLGAADGGAVRDSDVILVGFDDAQASGAVTCQETLSAALDLIAAKAVTARRNLAPDLALTILVSRVAPARSELSLLIDLVNEPGRVAALLALGSAPVNAPADQVAIVQVRPGRAGSDLETTLAPAPPAGPPQSSPLQTSPPQDNLTAAGPLQADLARAGEPQANLARAGQPQVDLAEAGLSRANLAQAGLPQANLAEAGPPPADLTRAGQPQANLARAGLPQADLARAGQPRANLAQVSPPQAPPVSVQIRPTRARADLGDRPPAKAPPPAKAQAPARPPTAEPPPAAEPPRPRPPAGLRIGVLGQLTINGQPGALLPAQTQLIVALAVNGSAGLSNAQLCDLLGADAEHPKPADSLRQLIARTRRQLGRAQDGKEWIVHLGHGQYALHPDSRVDWHEFKARTAAGVAEKDAGQLASALAMVRGQPFTGCYYWWLDIELVDSVSTEIVAAATALAELALVKPDPPAAARAARIGLVADGTAEELWRLLMRAEHAAGNLAGVREAWSRCVDAVAEIAADGQPQRATAALYHSLVGRTPAR